MKLAIVNGERREAERGLVGTCIGCEQSMTPVCGLKRVNHWRHKIQRNCDHWWENETDWHRGWKDNFPKDWQEIRHKDEETGEWHIADVKTDCEYIIEFQHSYLCAEEREARNHFYGEKLIWVVDGNNKNRHKKLFELVLKDAKAINQNSSIVELPRYAYQCPLIKDWSDCKVPVFFDLGHDDLMWCIFPRTPKNLQYAFPYTRQNFVSLHKDSLNGKHFSDFIVFLTASIFRHENPNFLTSTKSIREQPIQRPVTQRRVIMTQISLRELNYLMRPPKRQYRKYRK
jgi:hypothetical protein